MVVDSVRFLSCSNRWVSQTGMWTVFHNIERPMRLNLLVVIGMAGMTAMYSGCSKGDNESLPPAPPPPKAAPGVDLTQSAPAGAGTAESGAVPPPGSGQLAAPADAAPVKVAEDDLLGGNGRPLTEQEKILLNYGVSMFQQEKGRLPVSLEEAVAARYITRLPKLPDGEEFKYDKETGQVTVVKKGEAAEQ